MRPTLPLAIVRLGGSSRYCAYSAMSFSPAISAGWDEVVYINAKSRVLFMTEVTGTEGEMVVEKTASPDGEWVVIYRDTGRRF